MIRQPRIAFFTDTFHEVNGAARTCREFEAFASRRDLPFFSVHAGPVEAFRQAGRVSVLELPRSRASIALDADLRFDPLFLRLRSNISSRLRAFQPDLVHVTSSGDFGILGAIAAGSLRVPLALAWHTNVHEFAGRRVEKMVDFLPAGARSTISAAVERFVLNRTLWFYGRGDVLLAPNRELIDLLHKGTGKPVFLMERGIDNVLFSPDRRTRTDGTFVMGFVGRLQPEKNVRFLAQIQETLLRAGHTGFRFLIVGQGDERPWLEANLKQAEFTGVLRGEALAEAYANMDVFVFPSHTDTYGNVVQEAGACGVPSVVTSSGGPKFLVEDGIDGLVAEGDDEFRAHVLTLISDRDLQRRMGRAARLRSEDRSWNRVFERVYAAYSQVLHEALP